MFSASIQRYLASQQVERIDLRAVLFDMDGVLYNSMPNHTLAWQGAMESLGLSIERDEFYLHEGRTGDGTIDIYFHRFFHRSATDTEKKAIYAEKARRFNLLPPPLVMEGARELLQKVKEMGLLPVLVTGSGQRSLIDKLNRDFPDIFTSDYMVTAFDVQQGKPFPEPYLLGLKRGGITANQAIVIENAPLGVEAASTAGIFTVAIQSGPVPENVLAEAGAHLQFPSMQALFLAFDSLCNALHCERLLA